MFAFVRPAALLNRYIQNVPLNYIHLAAWLRQAGREVHILDMVIDGVTPDYVDRFIRERGGFSTQIGNSNSFPEFTRAVSIPLTLSLP